MGKSGVWVSAGKTKHYAHMNHQLQKVMYTICCKIHASLFLSSSGPHAMVQEALTDVLIVRLLCARQVKIYN